jgi:hypothetical protein
MQSAPLRKCHLIKCLGAPLRLSSRPKTGLVRLERINFERLFKWFSIKERKKKKIERREIWVPGGKRGKRKQKIVASTYFSKQKIVICPWPTVSML